ncbi:hypothetical protein ABEH87_00725 [Erwinia sp. Eh17-17]|uniref:hypothetical protein n=1 Tax=Erwinia sp. Eh17-17 TaxID=3080330 RepID=UPI00320A459E
MPETFGTGRSEKKVFITFAGNLRHGATGKNGRPLRRGHQHRYAAIGKMVFITFAGNLRHGATGKNGRPLRRGHQHRYAAIGKMVAPTTGTSTSAPGDRKNGIHHVCRKPSARGDRKKWSSSRLPEIFGTGRPEKKVAPYDGDINIGTRRPEKWSPLR